ncbi:transmembrane protease serine 9 [Anopheles darlingi]|uniref:transmembrane protease serine 9 n=1 Tax=Anopheles darlingi TaxID=43151 RepID=UPI002100475E|nr:transmembrane protease serine 9 [Anopheles darlingi]
MGIHNRIPLLLLLLLLLLSVLAVRSEIAPKCGKRLLNVQGLITQGTDAYRSEYPWHVAIFNYREVKSTSMFTYICGGSIISPNFVLSAAHCVVNNEILDLWKKPELFYFRAGAHNIKNETDGYNYNVSEIIVHPKYNQETYNNDLALLRTIGDISFDDPSKVLPICLPPVKADRDATIQELLGKIGFVAGWGTTENETTSRILQTLKVNALSMDSCRSKVEEHNHKVLDLDVMFCARGEKPDTNVCTGDSGGGLVYFKNEVAHLRGIVSFAPRKQFPNGITGCDPNGAVGYTDVARYIDWIAEQQKHVTLRNLLNEANCGIDPHENTANETEKPIFNQYPWNALLEVYRDTDKQTPIFLCGGVLIHKRFVLTVGHCVTGIPKYYKLKSVRLGEFKLFSPEDTVDGQTIKHQSIDIKQIIHNPDFNRPRYSNNLALIELAYDADIRNPNIKLICLPSRVEYVQTNLPLTGWKRNRLVYPTLSRNMMNWTSTDECRSQYKEKGVELPESSDIVYGTFRDQPEKHCDNYRAGSALQYIKHSDGKRRYFLAGLMTFNFPACHSKSCQMFATTLSSGSWIQETVNKTVPFSG